MALVQDRGQHAGTGCQALRIIQAQQEAVHFILLRLEAEACPRAGQRHVDAIALRAQLHALEIVLAQVAIGQHADHLQPDVVDLDQATYRIALREQVRRRLMSEYRDRRQRGLVVGGERAALRDLQ